MMLADLVVLSEQCLDGDLGLLGGVTLAPDPGAEDSPTIEVRTALKALRNAADSVREALHDY